MKMASKEKNTKAKITNPTSAVINDSEGLELYLIRVPAEIDGETLNKVSLTLDGVSPVALNGKQYTSDFSKQGSGLVVLGREENEELEPMGTISGTLSLNEFVEIPKAKLPKEMQSAPIIEQPKGILDFVFKPFGTEPPKKLKVKRKTSEELTAKKTKKAKTGTKDKKVKEPVKKSKKKGKKSED
eukprot:m.70146 g.70146  ORF g.70146 m.70146 type:complete len:185 (-) comp12110_c0_seq3:1336-1890(-)